MNILSFEISKKPLSIKASGRIERFLRHSFGRLSILSVALVMAAACSPATKNDEKRSAAESATGPNAMWYRFTFAADYQGQQFKIDQMVNCTRSVISGGSLGQSPDTVINEAHPMTVAAKMPDGSQVLVRVPDMCSRYRKFDKREGRWGYRAGWKSRGPHSLIPLVIWSDKMPRPDRIESYVARDYYENPRARVKNPKGSVDLLPVGQYPKNYAAVLDQENALPRYPNPFINPALDPNGRGKGRDGRYHGMGDSFVTYNIVPVENYNEWVDKYIPVAMENAQLLQAGLPPIEPGSIFLERVGPKGSDAKLMAADPAFTDPKFRALRGEFGAGKDPSALASEPGFVSSECVRRSIGKLKEGAPGMSAFPYDASDDGSPWPDQARNPQFYLGNGIGGVEFNPREHTHYNGQTVSRFDLSRYQYAANKLKHREARMRSCYARLSQLRSFEVIDGRLDVSKSIPGAMVYHRWIGPYRWMKPLPHASSFVTTKAVDPVSNSFKLSIDGSEFSYALDGNDRRNWNSLIFENKSTGSWYYVNREAEPFFSGKGENSGY